MSDKDRPKPQTAGPTPDAAGEVDPAGETIPTESVTGSDVEAAVRGAQFPAAARDLLDRARRNGADESVLERMAQLPERHFTSLGDALRALDMLS